MLAALACNLSGNEPQRGPTAQPTLDTTRFPPTPPFGLETATPYPTSTTTLVPSTPTAIPCVPYAAWTALYPVQAGDTLFEIAVATGTTVEQLVIANCLLDANMIAEGQLLRVPRLPVPSAPTLTRTPFATVDVLAPRFNASLTATRHWISAQTGQPTTYQPTVRVDLGEVYNADEVDFYVDDPAGGTAIPIGSDYDPWDGAFVDYDFPTAGSYTFVAYAINDQRTVKSNVFTVTYDPNFVPPEGRFNVLSIEPNTYFDGTQYILAVGASVTIQWKNAPLNAVMIDFYTLPYTTPQPSPQLIGSDRDLSDGGWITWQVPANLSGYIFGRATLGDGTTVESQVMTVVGR